LEKKEGTNVSASVSPFSSLGLSSRLVRALAEEGYTEPTPIQVRAIPPVLAGHDLLACAQTGTGKTAAFMLPVLQRLAEQGVAKEAAKGGAKGPGARVLVLAPTRELAVQIGERGRAYGKHLGLSQAVIYGGVNPRTQEVALRRGCDVLVATPGRLLDLAQQGHLSLAEVEILVLDEADRMLDMGFIHDVRRILARLPRRSQTLLFSATMPAEIRHLADSILKKPEVIAVAPKVTAAPTVTHAVWHVAQANKRDLLYRVLVEDVTKRRAIVFTRTKHGANRVCQQLVQEGLSAGVIHGNKSQSARERTLDSFREGTTRVLVATDIAARGIDVEDVGLVVNFDLPNVPESYVHRIGRAGRAGATGAAVSFCDPSEQPLLKDIERHLAFRISPANQPGSPSPAPRVQPASSAQPAQPTQPGQKAGHASPTAGRSSRNGQSARTVTEPRGNPRRPPRRGGNPHGGQPRFDGRPEGAREGHRSASAEAVPPRGMPRQTNGSPSTNRGTGEAPSFQGQSRDAQPSVLPGESSRHRRPRMFRR
jgi:ATP-dependent RNA helicase RhlE